MRGAALGRVLPGAPGMGLHLGRVPPIRDQMGIAGVAPSRRHKEPFWGAGVPPQCPREGLPVSLVGKRPWEEGLSCIRRALPVVGKEERFPPSTASGR